MTFPDTVIPYPPTKRWNVVKEKGIPNLSGNRLEMVRDSFVLDDMGYPIVRNAVIDCGRQSLKTELMCKRYGAYMLMQSVWIQSKRDYDDYRIVYGAPTQQQAERIIWQDLKKLIPEKHYRNGGRISESEKMIRTNWGAELWIFGCDKPERVEGMQLDGLILDESSNLKSGVWNFHLAPMLSARFGWSRHVGTPDFAGQGARDFKELSDRALLRNDNVWKRYHWPSWDVMTDAEIESRKQEVSALGFQQEYGGLWIDAPGRAYWEYNEKRNVRSLEFNLNLPICVVCDFNTEHHNWLLCQVDIPKMLETETGTFIPNANHLPVFHCIRQVYLHNASTQTMAKYCRDMIAGISEKHLNVENFIHFYGDYSGNQLRSEADDTNWEQIEEMFPQAKYHYEPSGAINKRLNKVNDALHSAAETIRLFVDSDCSNLMKDFQYVNRKDLFTQKATDLTHASDAVGYMIVQHEVQHFAEEINNQERLQNIGRGLGL